MMLHLARLLLCAVLIVPTSAAEPVNEQLLFDFDSSNLTNDWSAVGRDRITVTRERLPGREAEVRFAPSDWGLTVTTEGNAGLFCEPQRIPADWTRFDALSFWVHRPAGENAVSTLELQFLESDSKARFWRKVEINHTGWKRHTLPLAWFRWGTGRIPSWERVDRLGFWFRDKAQLSLDSITVSVDSAGHDEFLSTEMITQVAFATDTNVRGQRSKVVELVTNAPDLDVGMLSQRLAQRIRDFRQDFPFLPPPPDPALLVVFADREEYERFVPRFGQQFNSVAPPPKSSGYSFFGFALSYWDHTFGTDRPVYTHEIIHSELERSLRVANGGGWLHEGLASMYQLRAHPQNNFAQLVIDGINHEHRRLPLHQLCSGKRIPMNRYWQALTLWEFILSTPKYRDKLPQLFQAFQRLGSSDLNPHLELLGTTWETFTEDWIRFCQSRYGPTGRRD